MKFIFDSPAVEILCRSTFGSLCCIKHRKFEFDLFFAFFPNSYFGGRDGGCLLQRNRGLWLRCGSYVLLHLWQISSLLCLYWLVFFSSARRPYLPARSYYLSVAVCGIEEITGLAYAVPMRWNWTHSVIVEAFRFWPNCW